MDKKIKNIVFDLGGVIVNLNRQECIDGFREAGAGGVIDGLDQSIQKGFLYEFEVGRITEHEFCEEVRRQTGIAAGNAEICRMWNRMIGDVPVERVRRIAELKGEGYRIFMLSNTNETHWKQCDRSIRKALAELEPAVGTEDLFEKTFLSFEMHMAKPSPGIFERMLAEAEIKAEETLFIDDAPVNREAAAAVGIIAGQQTEEYTWMGSHGLHFDGFEPYNG
jgi:putative hydrolase of the HAD superfamily